MGFAETVTCACRPKYLFLNKCGWEIDIVWIMVGSPLSFVQVLQGKGPTCVK